MRQLIYFLLPFWIYWNAVKLDEYYKTSPFDPYNVPYWRNPWWNFNNLELTTEQIKSNINTNQPIWETLVKKWSLLHVCSDDLEKFSNCFWRSMVTSWIQMQAFPIKYLQTKYKDISKKIIHRDKAGFIPEMQRWLNIVNWSKKYTI